MVQQTECTWGVGAQVRAHPLQLCGIIRVHKEQGPRRRKHDAVHLAWATKRRMSACMFTKSGWVKHHTKTA